ncbi:HTH DNA binding protein [Mycobacterium phage Fowlmouth]|uniref:Helix-turn-helix DNA binding domain protein n=2 Tax=Fowlmouthvirus fowlmouth TaxID=2845652 RepID=A0A7G8LPV5_9CAUD|nr:HTH DNA binding protein [Mycobacterium phage Fowlmouth]AYN58014.1 hypothetical protein SEA_FOWLMOUTH_64 [Mycobacterium phage Fowlmouth]QNJ59277.1 hypothetical protein SEA_MRMIYAGI_63 [Mycobacterium phage MrMiyagi]
MTKKAKSIQAERDTSTSKLQQKTLRNAYRHGMTWDDDEVSLLVNGIQKDQTTFEMAMALGRSYYSVQGARAHVRFAMDHINVIRKAAK